MLLGPTHFTEIASVLAPQLEQSWGTRGMTRVVLLGDVPPSVLVTLLLDFFVRRFPIFGPHPISYHFYLNRPSSILKWYHFESDNISITIHLYLPSPIYISVWIYRNRLNMLNYPTDCIRNRHCG